MAAGTIPKHGGDLDAATRLYGAPPAGWLDLSTGINRNPYPFRALAGDGLDRLPSPSALADLTAAARSAYRLPAAAGLAGAPGSEVAVRLLPLVAPPGAVAVVSPTYGSHGEAWRASGRPVRSIATLAEATAEDAVVVLANPNNPDGRVTSPESLLALAGRLAARSGLLVVDEAFADLAPEISVAPFAGRPGLVILRSFGKFYGLAGLRLGFVAGDATIVARLAALLGDWPVSGPAIAIGRAALDDRAWQNSTRVRLADGTARLKAVLARHGVAVAGGTGLFTLVATADAASLHEGLARLGIWTRVFADAPGWLRLGLPGSDAEFDRLDRALAALRTPSTTRG